MSFREIGKIKDPDQRRNALLDYYSYVFVGAMGRQRTVGKDQHVVMDPDSHAAIKAVDSAAPWLGIEVARPELKPPDLGAFEQPTPIRAVK